MQGGSWPENGTLSFIYSVVSDVGGAGDMKLKPGGEGGVL